MSDPHANLGPCRNAVPLAIRSLDWELSPQSTLRHSHTPLPFLLQALVGPMIKSVKSYLRRGLKRTVPESLFET